MFSVPFSSNWWPFFVVVFYVLAPIPSIIARRVSEDTGGSNPCKELAYFVTAAIVVSAFGLPIVLARSPSTAPVVSVRPPPHSHLECGRLTGIWFSHNTYNKNGVA